MNDIGDILKAVRRSDQLLAEQVATWEALAVGVAFVAPELPGLRAGNQLRDAWLADVSGADAFAQVETYYAERGLACLSWTPASGQELGPVEAIMTERGWRRVERLGMYLKDWDAAMAAGGAVEAAEGPLRILPARAMPKALRETFEDDGEDAHSAMVERLNDSRLDCFVAQLDGTPVGRISYLEAGETARVFDLSVRESARQRGVGRALLSRVIHLARRLGPRAVVASVDGEDAAGRAFFERFGFAGAGALVEFHRPVGAARIQNDE